MCIYKYIYIYIYIYTYTHIYIYMPKPFPNHGLKASQKKQYFVHGGRVLKSKPLLLQRPIFVRALFLQSYVKNVFFTSKTRFSSKIVKNHVFFVKKHVYWASWRSPRPLHNITK